LSGLFFLFLVSDLQVFIVIQRVKLSFLLATLIGIAFNFQALLEGGDINWLAWLLTYGLCFSFFYFYMSKSHAEPSDDFPELPSSVNPDHLEALYKHAMIVERNAKKANLVFDQQLDYVKKVIKRARLLTPESDFKATHQTLIKELDVLELHIERLLGEMKKNVKLGEKLQQAVANIDPEIGVL
jgi:hypothetical protein